MIAASTLFNILHYRSSLKSQYFFAFIALHVGRGQLFSAAYCTMNKRISVKGNLHRTQNKIQ